MTIVSVKLNKFGADYEKSVNLIESLRGSGWSVLSVSETQEPQVIPVSYTHLTLPTKRIV